MDEEPHIPSPPDGQDGVSPEEESFRLRPYQTEMVEESIKRNIIVAMDTGSGKTHIAMSRSAAELERCDPEKRVWFIAPTIPLCEQQYNVYRSILPAYGALFLSGQDNVEKWSEQNIWDSVLHNVRIVVSTPAILCDALFHGFVHLSELALLIFDEAHHCVKNNPTNEIMRMFHKHTMYGGQAKELPAILGLSASPVLNASATGIEEIESNMSAQIVTPKIHRSELLQFVHRPRLIKIPFSNHERTARYICHFKTALELECKEYAIMEDPYILELIEQTSTSMEATNQLFKVMRNQKTYCSDSLRRLANKSNAIRSDLGEWAAEWYIGRCIETYGNMIEAEDIALTDWTEKEKKHLHQKLQKVVAFTNRTDTELRISPKVEALINTLITNHDPNFAGIIFVEQRAIAVALAHILNEHPATRPLFSTGAFVGSSSGGSQRKVGLADIVELKQRPETLVEFRSGQKNLLVSTDVLEEGIDVPSCHLVICFDKPKNLKSFIQKRGRARRKESKYFVLLSEADDVQRHSHQWHELEEKMTQAYMDNLRTVKSAEDYERTEEHDEFELRVPSTGAILNTGNALPHLNAFCAGLVSGRFVNARPQFDFDTDQEGRKRAVVILPIALDPTLRHAKSEKSWITEKHAKKDAAFQAYKALYEAGLINDNLLPLRRPKDAPEMNVKDERISLEQVSERLNPWISLASQASRPDTTWNTCLITIKHEVKGIISSMTVLFPGPVPTISSFPLYWNSKTTYQVTQKSLIAVNLSNDQIILLRQITRLIIMRGLGRRIRSSQDDFVVLLSPTEELDPATLTKWLKSSEISCACETFCTSSNSHNKLALDGLGIVREIGREFDPYIAKRFFLEGDCSSEVSQVEKQWLVEAVKFPKRRDFLHPLIDSSEPRHLAYETLRILDPKTCKIDLIPVSAAFFAIMLPCILHRFEIYMVAKELQEGLLAPVSISNLDLILTAITATAAGEHVNYQRLEYLGDCLLKFTTSISNAASHLNWPESYLTAEKGRTNSNSYLTKASISCGLDKYVIRKRFTGIKWQPYYISQTLVKSEDQVQSSKVDLSAKTLADIIESLIGASYVDGGLEKTIECIQTLMPNDVWLPYDKALHILCESVSNDSAHSSLHWEQLETLIGYTFRRKALLLEALTHPSFISYREAESSSYQRLEFLGDAILDYVISTRLYAHSPPLPHHLMHRIRTAMVNGPFLAFLAFELSIPEDRITMNLNTATDTFEEKHTYVEKMLWQFMRHTSPQIPLAQQAAMKRHNEMRHEILEALKGDKNGQYPWPQLCRTGADKFFCDLVESVIGAVFIDASCNDASSSPIDEAIGACEIFIERLGILEILQRILDNGIDCLHPKERLGHLAGNDEVNYIACRTDTTEQGRYGCKIKVGERDVGDIVVEMSRFEAETEAAWRACQILLAEEAERTMTTLESTLETDPTGECEELMSARGHQKRKADPNNDDNELDEGDVVELDATMEDTDDSLI